MIRPLLIAIVALTACSAADDGYVFRNQDRPEFSQVMTPTEMARQAASEILLLDVRLSEDFAAAPDMIPGAERRDPEQIAEWANDLPQDRTIVVYCVKGGWVSQKAANYLNDNGFRVRNLEGGLEAWKNSNTPESES